MTVMGEGGVGKTAITLGLVHGVFREEYDPTIEDSYLTKLTIDGKDCVINLIDTAGQEEFRYYFQVKRHRCFILWQNDSSGSVFTNERCIPSRLFRHSKRQLQESCRISRHNYALQRGCISIVRPSFCKRLILNN